ncbi:MAG: prepilin-type N-terminal cleavage/methylation domain-containing protein [Sedimentisphaerales bacterium]|nr:prepilin-type N-terminal cleavage/methylation domain-containing protein [Sedimentisphaerales bacterium]
MKIIRRQYAHAVTLVEVIVACVVLAVAVLGVLSYQYHATRRTIVARDKLTATRTCRLLMEDWKSNGGDENYDPSALELGFVSTGTADRYKIRVNDLPMVASLSWQDVDKDEDAGVTLREIRVLLEWRQDRQDDTIRTQDPAFEMTTYVRRDQSAG